MAKPRATDKVIAVNDDEELRRRGFNIGATLGEGAYAKVKCAFWEKINARVAIKIINTRKAPQDFLARFLPRELQVMRKIKHPNIIELFDTMEFNGKLYMILENAGHGDLLEYIKLRGALPEAKAKAMFFGLVTAIEALHAMDIIHRDLKCENVLLNSRNEIKLSDFGFARRQEEGELSRTFCGSAAYAAPEVLQGFPYNGKPYDIWSLGVILYIMVVGSMPYNDSNFKKMVRMQTERKVGFSRSPGLSMEVKDLIHRMLEAKVPQRITIGQVLECTWLAELRPPTTTVTAEVHASKDGEGSRRSSRFYGIPMDTDESGTKSETGRSSSTRAGESSSTRAGGSSSIRTRGSSLIPAGGSRATGHRQSLPSAGPSSDQGSETVAMPRIPTTTRRQHPAMANSPQQQPGSSQTDSQILPPSGFGQNGPKIRPSLGFGQNGSKIRPPSGFAPLGPPTHPQVSADTSLREHAPTPPKWPRMLKETEGASPTNPSFLKVHPLDADDDECNPVDAGKKPT